jgi:DNA-binding protein Fis
MRDVAGNKARAAKKLGISRMQLYSRLRKYGLETA